KAEGQRQTVFDNNEANRTETFNANEATRQENETTRQQAEAIRVENENQREIDHANISAELSGKADKKQEDWITPTLLNGFKGVANDTVPQFYKNSLGEVLIHGYVNGGQSEQTIFTLPNGY